MHFGDFVEDNVLLATEGTEKRSFEVTIFRLGSIGLKLQLKKTVCGFEGI